MFTITWRGIRQYPVRFVLSVLAVVLGIAFITGTFALRTSLSSTFEDITSGSYAGDVYVQAAADDDSAAQAMVSGGASALIDSTLADTIAQFPEVSSAEAIVEGTAVLIGKDGTPVTTNGAPTLAFPVSTESNMSLVAGRLPQSANEIALESSALSTTGFAVGDTTTMVIAGQIQPVTIVGELSYDSAAFGAILIAIDQQLAYDAFAPTGQVANISVSSDEVPSDDAVAAKRLAAEVAGQLGGDVTELPTEKDGYRTTLSDGTTVDVRTGASLRADTARVIDDMIGFVSVFLLVFAAVALFVGGFIIANTFAMSVRQRMREIAVLRAIGASPAQVFASVVGQAVVVGVVGALIGIAAGMGLIAIVRAVLESMGAEMSQDIPLTPQTVIIAIAAGVVVSATAAAVPARRAATIPPVAAMREEMTSEKSLRVRGVIGLILLLAGFACAITAGSIGADGGSLLGIGAASVLLGALLAAPLAVPLLLRVLAWPFSLLIKPMGALARGNVVRNPRRTASTAGALMIGMALVGGSAVLAASAQASVSTMIETSAHSDFVLQSAQMDGSGIPTAAATAIRDLPESGRVDSLYFAMVLLDGTQDFAVSGSSGLFPRSASLTMDAGDETALDEGEALVRESYANDNDLQLGDTITVTAVQTAAGTGSPTTLTIGGIYDDGSLISTSTILPIGAFNELVPEALRTIDTLFVSAANGVSTEQLRTALVDTVKPYYVISVMDQDEWVSAVANQIDQILYILYALLGLSIVIAILGIVNTLALSVIERTREIGLMRAVGLGRLQLSTTIAIESMLIAVFGALLGLGIGIALASFLPEILAAQGFTDLSVPWLQLGAMLVLAAAVGVVAAAWPAIRAARMPVLQSIASE